MTLIPYLHFEGNSEEVLNFYKDVLGGEIVMISRYGDAPMPIDEDWKNKIMHARLKFGDAILYVSDGPKNYKSNKGDNIQLSVDVPDENKIEEVFNKMAEGGTVTMPLADQFWGAKFGMLKDKYGIGWMFNCEKKVNFVQILECILLSALLAIIIAKVVSRFFPKTNKSTTREEIDKEVHGDE